MLRAIWDSWQNKSRPSFQGEHYTYTLMTPFFDPGPIQHPHVPIYISAVNPYMCRLVGELCDGVRLHGFCTPKYLKEVVIPNIEAGAKKAGRSLKDIDITGGGFVITGETEEDVERQKPALRQQIAFYGSTRTYKAVLDLHGWGETCLRLHQLAAEGRWPEMNREITRRDARPVRRLRHLRPDRRPHQGALGRHHEPHRLLAAARPPRGRQGAACRSSSARFRRYSYRTAHGEPVEP